MPTTPLVELTTHPEPELVFALVSAVGTDQESFERLFADFVRNEYGYAANVLRVSGMIKRIETKPVGVILDESTEFARIDSYMTAGNKLRGLANRGDILALHAIGEIRKGRKKTDKKTEPIPRTVHLLRSLKHPDEIETLRRVYGVGFFVIGLHASLEQRRKNLITRKGMGEHEANRLIERDSSEVDPLGQQTRDTFAMADVFMQFEDEEAQLKRLLKCVFGNPYETPTQDEHAMFLAFGASLRSAQMGRQVGAVIVSAQGEVIATGANDVPRFGGGQYWPGEGDQRDHIKGCDANNSEIESIISEIVHLAQRTAPLLDDDELRRLLRESRIGDITEFGRPVHAEMEALLACGRIGVSPKGATLYTTTFPCHNCAKHIVGAGIERVIYIEPYPKSKAIELHDDSIALDDPKAENRVRFLPFVGVAPRRYFDLFSMRLGAGLPMTRKTTDGKVINWETKTAKPRLRMSPYSYLERELIAMAQIEPVIETIEEKAAEQAKPPSSD